MLRPTFYERIRGGVCQCGKVMSAESQETTSTLGRVIPFVWRLLKENIFLEKYNSIPFVLKNNNSWVSVKHGWHLTCIFINLNSVFSKEVCESNIIMCPRCDNTCKVWWLSDTCSYAKVISSLFAFVHWLISTSRVWICQDLLCRAGTFPTDGSTVCLEEKEWSLHWKEHHASL